MDLKTQTRTVNGRLEGHKQFLCRLSCCGTQTCACTVLLYGQSVGSSINAVLNTVPSAKVEPTSNCLFIQDGRRLVVCDIESRWVSERPQKLRAMVG